MLKEYLKNHGMSIYKLCEITKIPYSTLNDLVNQKVDIQNVRAGILFQLSRALEISMDELYQLCSNEIVIRMERYPVSGKVFVRSKQYILEFMYRGKQYTEVLCPVKKEASMFIESIAKWEMEDVISTAERAEEYELYLKTQG